MDRVSVPAPPFTTFDTPKAKVLCISNRTIKLTLSTCITRVSLKAIA